VSKADRNERLRKILEKAGSSRDELNKLSNRQRLPGVERSLSEDVAPHVSTQVLVNDEVLPEINFDLDTVDFAGAAEQERLAAEARLEEENRLAQEEALQAEVAKEKARNDEFDRIRQQEILNEEKVRQETEALAQEKLRVADLARHEERLKEEAKKNNASSLVPPEVAASPIEAEGPVDDIQEDVLPIVLEEAQEELVPDIQTLLGRLVANDQTVLPELHRKVHTLKGSLAMVGAMRARAMMHSMETWMEKAEAGEINPSEGHDRLLDLFEGVKDRIAALARGDHLLAPSKDTSAAPRTSAAPAIQSPKRVHLKSDDVDRYITEINEARLANVSLATSGLRSRNILSDLDEKGQRLSRLLRELEIHAETQIQSRKTQIEETGEDFDPLEFDRYTHLQEISRFLSEGLNDVMDLQREMVGQYAEQETVVAYQGRAIDGVQEGLQRTRLIPADALGDRLHKVVWATSRELGRPTDFFLEGGRQALDRLLLERIAGPLEHILRNSIAHGVEDAPDRIRLGKPVSGSINMEIRQEAGRVHIIVKDDGRGLDPSKIKEKAVAKNLWPANRAMGMAEAADMICSAGFSTAETVSEVSGRGVGMDVVRSEVMTMGGRFEIHSTPGNGMTISIVLPTAIASISVVLAEAGGETWAIPVEMVEHMDRITPDSAQEALLADHQLTWSIGQERATMRCRQLSDLMGLSNGVSPPAGALLILRTGDQRAAVFVESLSGVSELPMRSLGRQWSSVPGIMGATILPDGRAGFLVDPLRADWSSFISSSDGPIKREKPLVLVVDDSITVRKVTARFLERNNYDAELAKDGQEAVEMLVDMVPDVILLDVEMPRMDGFDCARHIRENPKLAHVPIIMITSRTADKHRQRALSMGVNAYLGKPFKEEELLPLLTKFAKQSH
jgi:chemosensory pili system protein ChpA (sensor histidine kinase/response regulator)